MDKINKAPLNIHLKTDKETVDASIRSRATHSHMCLYAQLTISMIYLARHLTSQLAKVATKTISNCPYDIFPFATFTVAPHHRGIHRIKSENNHREIISILSNLVTNHLLYLYGYLLFYHLPSPHPLCQPLSLSTSLLCVCLRDEREETQIFSEK